MVQLQQYFLILNNETEKNTYYRDLTRNPDEMFDNPTNDPQYDGSEVFSFSSMNKGVTSKGLLFLPEALTDLTL